MVIFYYSFYVPATRFVQVHHDKWQTFLKLQLLIPLIPEGDIFNEGCLFCFSVTFHLSFPSRPNSILKLPRARKGTWVAMAL